MNDLYNERNDHSGESVASSDEVIMEDGSNSRSAYHADETHVSRNASSHRFDYSEFGEAFAAHAEEVAERIRNRMRASIIECGRDLLVIKATLKHGKFGDWLKCHFSFSERTAQNMMNAASAFGAAPQIVDVLPERLIYALSAKSTPDDLKQSLAQDVLAEKPLNQREVEQRLKDAVAAHRTSRNAERVEKTVAKERSEYRKGLKKKKKTEAEIALALAKWDASQADMVRQNAIAVKNTPTAASSKKVASATEEKVEINRQYSDEEIINDALTIYEDLIVRYEAKLPTLLKGIVDIYKRNHPKSVSGS